MKQETRAFLQEPWYRRRGRPPSALWQQVAGATLAATALLGTGRAHAQTLPLPIVPREAAPAAPSAPTQLWEGELELGGGYDTNVAFLPEGPGDLLLNSRAELARVFRGRRGRLRVGAASRAFVYATESVWNRVDAGASLSGSRALASNVALAVDGSAELGHTDTNTLLGDQGVLLPLSRTRSQRGLATIDWRFGARSSLHVDGRAYHTAFDDPRLVDSSSQRGSLALARRVTDRASLSVQYSVEQARSGFSYLTQFGSLQWDQVLSKRSALLLEGGTSRTGQAATSGLASPWNFYGGVSFTREVGRSRVVVFARREVAPVFGIGGLQLSDRLGVRANVPIGRAWELGFSGTYISHGPPEGDASDRPSSDEAEFTLHRSIGRRFFLGAGAQYRRQGPRASTPKIESFQGGLVIGVASSRFDRG